MESSSLRAAGTGEASTSGRTHPSSQCRPMAAHRHTKGARHLGSGHRVQIQHDAQRTIPRRAIDKNSVGAPEVGGVYREPTPVPAGYAPGVVAGARTRATPLLSTELMVQRLQKSMHERGNTTFGAFYSSAVGGIVTDPALMLLPIDDQMVVKGYGIGECVLLREGYLYMLDEHVGRLEASCDMAGLEMPFSQAALKRIILDTAATSKRLNGIVRFWVTPGRGGFTPLDTETEEPGFYAICVGDVYDVDRTTGWGAITEESNRSPYGSLITNQHLQTAVAQRRAADSGAEVVIFTDQQGFVRNCAGYNLCILTKRDVLVFPPFSDAPPSVMLQRMLQMMPAERARSPDDVIISEVQQRELHISEVEEAKEAFVVCSNYLTMPVVSVDGKPIADGKPGITVLALHYMLDNDMVEIHQNGPTPYHTEVPYGYFTGMRSQLT